MDHFAEVLSRHMGRPVLNKTGLAGAFDFTLTFPVDDAAAASPALEQQLGLKLVSTNAPVEMLVIDSAERIPSGN
jgi:uncharacterized protein (TIGR03435 family)